MYFWLK